MEKDNLLSSGKLAALAHTTKRTVRWYQQKGLLKADQTAPNGYRFFSARQVINLEFILLLRKLGFSLVEIKGYHQKSSLAKLFKDKKLLIKNDIQKLTETLNQLEGFYQNLGSVNSLVKPTIKDSPPFDYYFIEKIGPYDKINDYCSELLANCANIPKYPTYLITFEEEGFRPNKALMKIGILAESCQPKKNASIKRGMLPRVKCYYFKYTGSPSLLSLLWEELDRLLLKNSLKANPSLPAFELDHCVCKKQPPGENIYDFELFIPLK